MTTTFSATDPVTGMRCMCILGWPGRVVDQGTSYLVECGDRKEVVERYDDAVALLRRFNGSDAEYEYRDPLDP